MVAVPVKLTFNFDEDKKKPKKPKSSGDESSTDDDSVDSDASMPDFEEAIKQKIQGGPNAPPDSRV